MAADQQPQVVAEAGHLERLLGLLDLDPATDADGSRHVLEQLTQLAAGPLSSRAGRGRRDLALSGRRDHPRRRVADAEQPPLAFRENLESHRGLVERRDEELELAERPPLRLSDRLAGRLDRAVGAHLRPCPRLRFTRRGWVGAWRGFGARPGFGATPAPERAFAAPLPSSVAREAEGVRDERFGAAGRGRASSGRAGG